MIFVVSLSQHAGAKISYLAAMYSAYIRYSYAKVKINWPATPSSPIFFKPVPCETDTSGELMHNGDHGLMRLGPCEVNISQLRS